MQSPQAASLTKNGCSISQHPLLQSTEALVSQMLCADAGEVVYAEQEAPEQMKNLTGVPAPGTPGRSDALLLTRAVRRATNHPDAYDEEDGAGCGDAEGARSDAKLGPTPPNSNGAGRDPLLDQHPPQPCQKTDEDLLEHPDAGTRIRASNMRVARALVPPSECASTYIPRAPQPCLQTEEGLLDKLAALRPDDPRQRMVETMGGAVLRPRWDFAVTVAAWGCSHNYQLGTGQYAAQRTPKIVAPLQRLGEQVCEISCGADHCAAVDTAGRLFTWGLSDHGRLGLQPARDAPVPSQVSALINEHIVSVVCGMYSSACISSDLKVFTWGAGSKGQLGHVEQVGSLALLNALLSSASIKKKSGRVAHVLGYRLTSGLLPQNDEWLPRMVACLQGVLIVQVNRALIAP